MGLITADEVSMAGGTTEISNSSYYLYTNEIYWLGTPYQFVSKFTSAYEFYVYDGSPEGHAVDDAFGARPVVSLSSKAKLSGSGTYDDVYTVS